MTVMENIDRTYAAGARVRAVRERIAATLGPAAGALAAHPDPLPAIDRAVARRYGVAAAALASPRRSRDLRRARRMAWALGYAGARRSIPALGRRYGKRRAAGIAAAVERFAAALAGGAVAASELAALVFEAAGGHGGDSRGVRAPEGAPEAGEAVCAPRAARRACLTCGAAFDSAGAHNRMCDGCRENRSDEPDAFVVHVSLAELAELP